MLRGYRKCTKGIRKLLKKALSFDRLLKIARGNVRRVLEILGGYQKCTKGIGKFKN